MCSKEKVLVQFENVQERYFIDDNKPIKIEYVLNVEYESSTKDWLGIFPKGWRDFEQQLYVDWAVARSNGSNKRRKSIEFDLRNLPMKMNCFNADYQIVYVSKDLQICGRSSYFRLQKKCGDIHSSGDGLYEGLGTAQLDARTNSYHNHAPNNIRLIVPLAKSKNCTNNKIVANKPITTTAAAAAATTAAVTSWPINSPLAVTPGINGSVVSTKFPLVRPFRSECLLPVSTQNRDYGAPRCDFCQRTKELLIQKQSLYTQLKDLAEVNNEQKRQLAEMEKKLELSMVAQKRLKLHCHHIRQEKRSYELFVSDLIRNLHGNSPVCVLDKGCEMMIQRVNTNLESHLMQLTMKHSPQNDRYLKAVIGSQELKIQELTARLAELESQISKSKVELKKNYGKTIENDGSVKLELKAKLNETKSVTVVEKFIEGVKEEREKQEEGKSMEKFPHPIDAIVEIRNSVDEKLEGVLVYDVNNNDYDDEKNESYENSYEDKGERCTDNKAIEIGEFEFVDKDNSCVGD